MLWEDQFDGRDQVGLERGGVETLQVGSREGGRGNWGEKQFPDQPGLGGPWWGARYRDLLECSIHWGTGMGVR